MSFNLVALPVQSLGAGSARHSDVARLVEALTVELAGEKIDLPSFPDVATRVRRALTNEQVDVEQVVRIVSAEPALAARLLQLANSAALNPNGRRLTDLRTAVSRRMVADVPVGVLLSGGIDSSLVVALLAEQGQHGLETFSIGFDSAAGESGDEYEYSDLVAETFGTAHHKIHIDSSRLLPAVPATIAAMSEPMVSHDCVAF